ncbi:sigma-70 family RNA polymerase sigma factor [Corticibacter populi]|uniref:Sigma-70 family RNA polymerase sigma factor n=1 Tax=Corticibacter populi TaxID=1550736 RepID=A0A3M6QQE0_9BURK|nr:sigma-70 family RNA polymerase sigma factor [Corticibacter populi]RMX05021.1 sigma-70 family RNA polymerase sigma factor [Corticibacter populi]RZS33545.1 RNA polymerase sigma-70 factor (ECF subfamily) [Corticibacter populi]
MFERYYRELLNFLGRKVADRAVAADLTQETYVRIYATLAREPARSIRNPRALLYRIARNLLTDHYRRGVLQAQLREPAAEAEAGEDGLAQWPGCRTQEPEVIVAARQRLEAIERAIAALPARPREAFMLYRIEGLGRAEVAARMGIGIKTVETHLEVAMQACLEQLAQLDEGLGCVDVPPRRV